MKGNGSLIFDLIFRKIRILFKVIANHHSIYTINNSQILSNIKSKIKDPFPIFKHIQIVHSDFLPETLT